ncbi:MAG: AMP-binding protein, partial [Nitrospiraceae bacterium]|nr:AMP-binding protein [Nitrospiraceae bacterium]
APFLIGASVTLLPSMKELARTAGERHVTVIVSVPQMLDLLLGSIKKKIPPVLMPLLAACRLIREKTGMNPGRAVFSKAHAAFGRDLRLFVSGGARLAPKTMRDLEGLGFTVSEGYGLTETSPAVTFNPVKKRKPGSAGKPIASAGVKIEEGEVLIRGPMLMKGYWRKPQETAQAIENGWLHTGDTGWLDEDGYLHITGRKKEIIVLSSGKNIYPEDVEKRYGESPLIKEMAVYESGGALKGVVVPDFEYARRKAISNLKEEIRWELMRIGQGLPSYMRVKGFTLSREPLARTPLGKIKRYRLEESVAPAERKKTGPGFLSGPGAKIARALAQAAGHELHVCAGDNLELDLGLDSLKKIELLNVLEEGFGFSGERRLPEDFLAGVQNAGELLEKMGAFLERPAAGGRSLAAQGPERAAETKITFSPAEKAASLFILLVLRLLAKALFRAKAKGVRNIPDSPFILAPNHSSLLDGFIVAALLPYRAVKSIFFMGWETYFRWPVSLALGIIHVIPIDLGPLLGSALRKGAEALGQGYSLCIFPEGGRSFDGRLMELKPGIAAMAGGSAVPIVPAWIEGAARALPRGAWMVRPVRIEIRFGSPLYPEDFESEEELLAALAGAIRRLSSEGPP